MRSPDSQHARRARFDPTEITGRGLLIVDRLSDAWGVEERVDTVGIAPGKCVWFRGLESRRSRPRENASR